MKCILCRLCRLCRELINTFVVILLIPFSFSQQQEKKNKLFVLHTFRCYFYSLSFVDFFCFFLFIFLFQINEMVLLVHLNIQTFLVLHIYNFNKYFYIQIDCCRFVSIVCVHHQHLQIEPLTMHLVLEII